MTRTEPLVLGTKISKEQGKQKHHKQHKQQCVNNAINTESFEESKIPIKIKKVQTV